METASSKRRFALFALVTVSVLVAAHLSDVRLGALFDSQGSASAMALLEGLSSPDLSADFLARIARLSLESLLIGVLGTVLAVAVGFSLSTLAIRVPDIPDRPLGSAFARRAGGLVRLAARFVLGVFRSIPDIVWAYLFVRLVGLGPGPAVLAIGVSTGGIIGKLFAELAEAIDPEPIHAMRRAGVGRLGILLNGVLPQVRRQWVGYALFRLECSIRSASILGVVGAGGLGSEIALSVRYFEYDKLATALLAVLAFVVAFELLSGLLRRRRARWTVWSGSVGALVAFWYLDIPWSQIWSSSLLPDSIELGSPAAVAAFAGSALVLILETVAMAWCATLAAAALAFVIAPLAAGTLAVRGHQRDGVRGQGPGRALAWLVLVSSRLVLQVCRAMPELTLAFVFLVWVGPGPFAGVLAIAVHTLGVLGRLYSDVYEEVERRPVAALEATGAPRIGVWLYGVVPQVTPRLVAFTLYRFEVNVRATAMVGFIGAGGIGDAIHTSISLFHVGDLVVLLALMLAVVTAIDWFGDRLRFRVLTARYGVRGLRTRQQMLLRKPFRYGEFIAPAPSTRMHERRATWKPVFFRPPADDEMTGGYASSVSIGGMFIHSDTIYPRGMVLEVVISPPDARSEEELESCMARVVYLTHDGDSGMGVELLDAAPRFLELLGASDEQDDAVAQGADGEGRSAAPVGAPTPQRTTTS